MNDVLPPACRRPNECNNPRSKSNQWRMREAHENALGDFRGENVKFRGRNAIFCAPQSVVQSILRRNMLEISQFQKNFTNRIFSR